MRYKVGDRVKYVKKIIHHNVVTGGIFTITHIDENNKSFQYLAESKKGNKQWFKEEEIQKVEYTYKDLEKASIGTKLTFEDGEVLVKDDKDIFENSGYVRNILELNNFKSRILGKIIKIEEPTYETVYEYKPEILDEVEKKYLSNVIRPFRENVRFITKRRYWIDSTEYNDISICIINNSNIVLPKFIANKMYKGMEIEKTYTLEELGL